LEKMIADTKGKDNLLAQIELSCYFGQTEYSENFIMNQDMELLIIWWNQQHWLSMHVIYNTMTDVLDMQESGFPFMSHPYVTLYMQDSNEFCQKPISLILCEN
jgi:hypothetical protein